MNDDTLKVDVRAVPRVYSEIEARMLVARFCGREWPEPFVVERPDGARWLVGADGHRGAAVRLAPGACVDTPAPPPFADVHFPPWGGASWGVVEAAKFIEVWTWPEDWEAVVRFAPGEAPRIRPHVVEEGGKVHWPLSVAGVPCPWPLLRGGVWDGGRLSIDLRRLFDVCTFVGGAGELHQGEKSCAVLEPGKTLQEVGRFAFVAHFVGGVW